MRNAGLRVLVAVALCAPLTGCAELYFYFGPNGLFPPGGTGTGGTPTPNPGTGGLQNPDNTIPTTTQPAPVSPPLYRISLLDDLLEQTAGATMITATDLDNDTVSEFASISSQSQVVLLHIRDTAGRFQQISVAGGLPLTRMVRIAAADVDSDGRTDLVVAVNHTGLAATSPATKVGQVVVIFAPADPRDALSWLTVPLTNSLRQNDDLSITDLIVRDFDNVNGPDIVFMSNEPPAMGAATPRRFVYFFSNPGPAMARTAGAWGTPRPSVLGVLPPFIEVDAPNASQIIPADIDGDGDLDIVASFPPAESFNIRWLENPGPANIDPNPAVALPRWNRHFVGQQDLGANVIALGDIDGDGDTDVAAGTSLQGLVQWFQNPGPPAVGIQDFPWQVYNVGLVASTSLNQLHLADLNNDGRLDVWVAGGGTMYGFFPRSGASFLDYWTPFTIANTNPVATIGFPAFLDIDGNGTTDFVVPLDRDGVNQDSFAIFARR
ncbi:MAG: VCBS repeat-containing protein [Phycisphaerae bacterium]